MHALYQYYLENTKKGYENTKFGFNLQEFFETICKVSASKAIKTTQDGSEIFAQTEVEIRSSKEKYSVGIRKFHKSKRFLLCRTIKRQHIFLLHENKTKSLETLLEQSEETKGGRLLFAGCIIMGEKSRPNSSHL